MTNGSRQGAVDIIIPVHNHYGCTRALLEDVYRYSDLPFHLLLVDNASTDETVGIDRIYTRDITIVRNRTNPGWCAAVDQAIELGRNPWLAVMKNGVRVSQGWLGNLISFLESHPRIGAVGPLASSPRDWQCVDRVRRDLVPEIPRFLTRDLHERNRILGHHFHRAGILVEGPLSMSCLALSRRAIERAGPLDQAADGEYCRRLRKAGYVLGLSLDTYVTRPADGKATGARRPARAAKA